MAAVYKIQICGVRSMFENTLSSRQIMFFHPFFLWNVWYMAQVFSKEIGSDTLTIALPWCVWQGEIFRVPVSTHRL
jgi:hypothetical protein